MDRFPAPWHRPPSAPPHTCRARVTRAASALTLVGLFALSAPGPLGSSSAADVSPAGATPVATPPEPVFTCSVSLTPTPSLPATVRAAPANTTFCLGAGTYSITTPVVPRSGDNFVGSPSDRPVIDASATTIGIDARGATNVTLENIVVSGASIGPGAAQCPACGRGVFAGDGIQLWNVELTGNGQNGIAGSQNTETPWLIVDSQIVDNGSTSELGYASGGIKGVNPYTILNSYVADNIGSGIWCDVGCLGGNWTVEGNTVTGNTRDGILYEISDAGATIEDNDVEGNNTSDGAFAGIELSSSGNATVEDNTSAQNTDTQIRVTASGRDGATVENDQITDNTVAGGRIVGCTLTGVTCSGNV